MVKMKITGAQSSVSSSNQCLGISVG